jgi:hypothetical protein
MPLQFVQPIRGRDFWHVPQQVLGSGDIEKVVSGELGGEESCHRRLAAKPAETVNLFQDGTQVPSRAQA